MFNIHYDYSVFEERLIAFLNNTIAQVGQGQTDTGEWGTVPAGPSEAEHRLQYSPCRARTEQAGHQSFSCHQPKSRQGHTPANQMWKLGDFYLPHTRLIARIMSSYTGRKKRQCAIIGCDFNRKQHFPCLIKLTQETDTHLKNETLKWWYLSIKGLCVP